MTPWKMIHATVMQPYPEISFEGVHMIPDPEGGWYKRSQVEETMEGLKEKIDFIQNQYLDLVLVAEKLKGKPKWR